MKQQLTKRWERIMSLALAACLGIGLFTPGAMAANGSDMVLIEGDPVPSADSDYRASTYVQTSNPSAYANLSTDEALALAARNGDQVAKYFNVTMFDYEGSNTVKWNDEYRRWDPEYSASNGDFNDAQRQNDVEAQGTDLEEWQGLYFSGGNPTPYSFQYDGFTSEAGYYPAENITYNQLLDSQNTYYVLQNGEYVPVTAESVSKTDHVALKPQPKVTEGFPHGNQSYYMEYQGSYYRITGSEWHKIRTNWGYYEIKGILDEATTLELGPMDAAAQVGVSVADIPVTSVDAGQPAPAEPDVTTGPVETTEPSETTDPAETTEPSETADPAETTEPSETTEPVETTEPTQPAQPPEELPEAPSDAGALLAGEVVIARTEESYYWFGRQEHTIQGTVLEKKTLYSVTLRAGEREIFKGDVNSLDEVFNGERLYEHREAGTPVQGGTTGSLPYAAYNFWTGDKSKFGTCGNNEQRGGWVYNGLMEDKLDRYGNPVFTVPDAGIFTTEPVKGKSVYTNVGLPFVDNDGYYIFDSSQHSARFADGAKSNINLTFSSEPQSGPNNAAFGTTGFFPFNSQMKMNLEDYNYHFGMRLEVDFTMTEDGMWGPEGTEKQPITFEFSGDDDVWVFVDDTLVLDLGGIHDAVTGSIDFQSGMVQYKAMNNGSYSGVITQAADGKLVYSKEAAHGQQVTMSNDFYSEKLNTTRDRFAAEEEHTLTVFYLERGAGGSNCKIKFNLPQRDSLTVSKRISEVDSEGVAVDEEVLAALRERDYRFTLYSGENIPVTNRSYAVYEDGQIVGVRNTGTDGHFALKDGQSARFFDMEYDKNTPYYVIEDVLGSTFAEPTWNATVTPQGNGTVEDASGWTSNKVIFTKVGIESAEEIQIQCTNTVQHISKVTMDAADDVVVVDFGLPVLIDVLTNDTAFEDTKSVQNVTVSENDKDYGSAVVENGKVKFTLDKPLDRVITLTYTAKAQGKVPGDVATDTATVTIIPATQMYYEQDFKGLVSYNGASGIEWSVGETAKDATQEGNVVEGKSPYGADTFYANATGDSAKGVASVDTTTGWASFTYDFTGTGTAILARLESDTGYIYVTVKNKNSDGTADYRLYRDTRVGAGNSSISEKSLYNIPVYQITGLDYGTYTVEVRIAKPLQGVGKYKAGNMFYLDGIRVYDPLNPNGLDEVAATAYQDDNESYNKVVSLRDKLINDYASVTDDGKLQWESNMDNFVTLTDTNGELTIAEDYKNIGPKEELYLDKGQSVTFDLVNWDPDKEGGKLYLGMKGLTGDGSVKVGDESFELNNTIDQYYDISKFYTKLQDGRYTFTIEVTKGPVSLTNIKVTGNADFAITESPEVTFG